jgi:hypothetical protein
LTSSSSAVLLFAEMIILLLLNIALCVQCQSRGEYQQPVAQQQRQQQIQQQTYQQHHQVPYYSQNYQQHQQQVAYQKPAHAPNSYYQTQQSVAYVQNNYQNPANGQNSQNFNNNNKKQILDSRFQADDPSSSTGEFTPRPTRVNKPTTDLPRPPSIQAVNMRFDDYSKRTINWDPELSQETEKFSLKLFIHLASEDENQNIMISPYSIHSLLVLIAEGAAGQTYEQIKNTVGLISNARTRDFHTYVTTALK